MSYCCCVYCCRRKRTQAKPEELDDECEENSFKEFVWRAIEASEFVEGMRDAYAKAQIERKGNAASKGKALFKVMENEKRKPSDKDSDETKSVTSAILAEDEFMTSASVPSDLPSLGDIPEDLIKVPEVESEGMMESKTGSEELKGSVNIRKFNLPSEDVFVPTEGPLAGESLIRMMTEDGRVQYFRRKYKNPTEDF